MGIVLSHQTALRALRTWDFIPHGRRSPLCPNLSCGRSAARDNATCFPIERPTAKQVSALRRVPSPFPASEGGRPSLFDGPIHILVPEPGQRSQMRGVASHVWASPLPPALLREIQPGLLCAGPELCYAQLASVLDPVELVLLGNELLGTWTPYPPSPPRHRRATCADRRRPVARCPRPDRGASGRRASAPVPRLARGRLGIADGIAAGGILHPAAPHGRVCPSCPAAQQVVR